MMMFGQKLKMIKNCRFLRQINITSTFCLVFLLFASNFALGSAIEIDGCKTKHWTLPVNDYENPEILKLMDLGLSKYAAGHRGVDFAGNVGDPIVAPSNGKVLWKGVAFGNPTVTFEVNGLKNTFQPATTPLPIGSVVNEGDLIGQISEVQPPNENHCDTSCLHWGLVKMSEDEDYLNPLALVYRKKVVLRV
jgi:hypothetical protein